MSKSVLKFFLLLLVLIPFYNIHAQYFIDQDKIDRFKTSKEKQYTVGERFKSPDYKVYLEGVSSWAGGIEGGAGDYVSDVMVGFDKIRYSRGAKIILTFKRGTENARIENEQIYIAGYADSISADGFDLEKFDYGLRFYLEPNETKRVYFIYKNRNQELDRIALSIGRIGHESRGYVIPYPPVTIKKNELKWYKKNNSENKKGKSEN